jgi:hypothetical protein
MMAMAIEQTVDLRQLTIEDLVGRFNTAEEGYDLDDTTDAAGKLLLTEEEWEGRARQRGLIASHGSASSGKDHKPKTPSGDKPAHTGGASGSGTQRKGNCRYCGKAGHWAKECRKAQRDRERNGEAANIAEAQVDPPALLLATAVEKQRQTMLGHLVRTLSWPPQLSRRQCF